MLTTAEAPAPAGRTIAGIGRVLLWNGGVLWIGRTGRIQAHAHHAIQIVLALEGDFLLCGADGCDWQRAAGAIVLPDRRHAFDGGDRNGVMLFVEPETVHGRALLGRYGGADFRVLAEANAQPLADALRGVIEAGAEPAALIATAQAGLAQLAGPVQATERIDARIERAIAWMRERLGAPIGLGDAAAVAHLSASRFRHLFVAQTGISFRAWLLWARVGVAMAGGLRGRSWTEAAQEAGFADSAHLSRTCRRMFGLSPAMLARG